MSESPTMPALVFEFNILKLAVSKLRGMLDPAGYWKPGGAVGIVETPRPKPIADDWVVVKTALSGICGSDMKELTLDGAPDNPLRSLLSFPQIMGHEVTGVIDEAGPGVKLLKPGDRVAVSSWFPCKPRGIDPECPRCRAGDYTHCENFREGRLPIGMHLGVTPGFGGFAPYVAVHESQCFVMPDNVSFEQAVLADPFAVAFHSCILLDPDPKDMVLVYGLGVIGLLTIICLKELFNVGHIVAVGRHPFQVELAKELGAKHVFKSRGSALVEEVAGYTGAELYTPDNGSRWASDGVDGIIDTIGSAETMEAGIRFLTTKGRLVFTGVGTPKRCENTPHYAKELEVIGSNAFAVEDYKNKKAHAFEFFLDFLEKGLVDTGHLVTHKFPLEQYQATFNTLADKNKTGAIKAVFDFSQHE